MRDIAWCKPKPVFRRAENAVLKSGVVPSKHAGFIRSIMPHGRVNSIVDSFEAGVSAGCESVIVAGTNCAKDCFFLGVFGATDGLLERITAARCLAVAISE